MESTGDVALDNAVKQWLEFDKVSGVIFNRKDIYGQLASLKRSC